MKKVIFMFSIVATVFLFPYAAGAQELESTAKLSTEPTVNTVIKPEVTAVYGISADDYLPTVESTKSQLRPKVRRAASRPAFDLPDAFYFIGGPIFILLFLSILVVFINGFEEKRKEEMRVAARDTMEVE